MHSRAKALAGLVWFIHYRLESCEWGYGGNVFSLPGAGWNGAGCCGAAAAEAKRAEARRATKDFMFVWI